MTLQIQRTTFKVSDFINWQKYGGLVLSPKFQRRSVWNSGARSYLIDTILKGLPIPVIILRDVKTNLKSYDSKKEVVDGQQRLRSIISYIAPELIPDELTFKVKPIHNKEAGNKLFTDLSENMQQQILDFEFFVHVLPSTVSDREILEIFARMNSTGTNLNTQELRNAKYYGEFKTLVYTLALEYYDFWLDSRILTDTKISRMAEVELMNDLFTIVLDGIIDRSPEKIDNYYKGFDESGSLKDKEELVSRLKNTLDFIKDNFYNVLKDTPFTKTTLFYSLFAVVYDLKFGLGSSLSKKMNPNKIDVAKFKERVLLIGDVIEAEDFNVIPEKVFVSYTKGTNRLNARKNVFEFLKVNIQNGW